MTKPANKLEKKHLSRIAEMGCLICGMPAEIHHLLAIRPRNHRFVTPLCHRHHRTTNESLHGMGNEKKWFASHGFEDIVAWAESEWKTTEKTL